MLDVNTLSNKIAEAIKITIIPAIEQCKLNEYGGDSDVGKKSAKTFATGFDELVTENLSKLIANAIDYYIKNADITGSLITNGSPTTHMCNITAAPMPVVAGKIPNTLGIS